MKILLLIIFITFSICEVRSQVMVQNTNKEVINVDLFSLVVKDPSYKVSKHNDTFTVFKKETPSFFIIISFEGDGIFKGMAVNFKQCPIFNQSGTKITEILMSEDELDAYAWLRVMGSIDILRNTEIKASTIR